MGLGKTAQLVALILAVPSLMQCRATLVVCPATAMHQWKKEIQKYLKPHKALKVLLYYGANRSNDCNFDNYDVVLTTYGTMAAESSVPYSSKAKHLAPPPAKQPLFDVNWHRVILDEAHLIKNRSSRTAQSACLLMAHHRWLFCSLSVVTYNQGCHWHSHSKFVN